MTRLEAPPPRQVTRWRKRREVHLQESSEEGAETGESSSPNLLDAVQQCLDAEKQKVNTNTEKYDTLYDRCVDKKRKLEELRSTQLEAVATATKAEYLIAIANDELNVIEEEMHEEEKVVKNAGTQALLEQLRALIDAQEKGLLTAAQKAT